MKITAITFLVIGLFASSLSITITENANPSKAPIVEEQRSKTQKRESSDQTAAEDKARSSVTEQNFDNKQNFKESTIQYETSFIPSNSAGSNNGDNGGQYFVSAATPQVQYAKPEINQIEYNKLEAPTSTVQYTQHYRNVVPTYQTLSYSGYHPSHAKLAPIQYITSPVSSPAPVHYATDYLAHASVPSIQYAAVAVPVAAGGNGGNSARVHHPVAYAPNSYINYGHQTSPAQLQLAYAVHIPQQVQQYLKQSVPGIQYATMTGSQAFATHSGSNSGHGVVSGQAASAPTNQHYYVAAAPQAASIPANIEYSPKPSGHQHQQQQQQLYYAVVPNYHHGYQHGNGGFAIAVQQQHQPSTYQLQANKQHVLATNSIVPGSGHAPSGHVQIAPAPAIIYKQQQHFVPATYVTSPSPSAAAPHNSASSFSTYSAQLPSAVPTAAAAIAHQYKSAPALAISTTSKPATIFATTTTVSPVTSGVVYQHQPNHHQHHQQQQLQQQLQPQPQQQHPIQHRHTPRFIYAAAAQTSPVYAHPPGNIHYGTHLYHPLLARSIIAATPSSIGI